MQLRLYRKSKMVRQKPAKPKKLIQIRRAKAQKLTRYLKKHFSSKGC